MQPWFESNVERLQKELTALDDAEISYEIDAEYKSRGRLRLHLVFKHSNTEYRITADYPDLFPFFAPDAYLDGRTLARHHHPAGGHLCLLGRRTDQWNVDDTLAGILQAQLPLILNFDQTRDEAAVKAVEEPQGEPVSVYFNSLAVRESLILFDGSWVIPESVTRGEIELWYSHVAAADVPVTVPKGIVGRVFDHTGRVVAEWSGPRPSAFNQSLRVRWVRAKETPTGTLSALHEQLSQSEDAYLWSKMKLQRKGQWSVAAVLFRRGGPAVLLR